MTEWKRNPGLPVRKLAPDPEAHVIMTPQLREWLGDGRSGLLRTEPASAVSAVPEPAAIARKRA